jgi:hypothetical protein
LLKNKGIAKKKNITNKYEESQDKKISEIVEFNESKNNENKTNEIKTNEKKDNPDN